jgi:hypothetical protein
LKPVAAPEGLEWSELPTFEQLHRDSSLKIAALRTRLVAVRCYKCEDNTVRYDGDEAAAAISNGGDAAELLQGDNEGRVDLLGIVKLVLQMLSDVRKDKADVIRSMQGPLDTGLKLVDSMIDKLLKANEKYAHDADASTVLMQTLHEAMFEREIRAQQATQSIKMRDDMTQMVKQQVPTLISKWSLTKEAGLALEVLGKLDPKVFDVLLTPDFIEDTATLAKARELVTILKTRASQQPPAEQAEQSSDSHPSPNGVS